MAAGLEVKERTNPGTITLMYHDMRRFESRVFDFEPGHKNVGTREGRLAHGRGESSKSDFDVISMGN